MSLIASIETSRQYIADFSDQYNRVIENRAIGKVVHVGSSRQNMDSLLDRYNGVIEDRANDEIVRKKLFVQEESSCRKKEKKLKQKVTKDFASCDLYDLFRKIYLLANIKQHNMTHGHGGANIVLSCPQADNKIHVIWESTFFEKNENYICSIPVQQYLENVPIIQKRALHLFEQVLQKYPLWKEEALPFVRLAAYSLAVEVKERFLYDLKDLENCLPSDIDKNNGSIFFKLAFYKRFFKQIYYDTFFSLERKTLRAK